MSARNVDSWAQFVTHTFGRSAVYKMVDAEQKYVGQISGGDNAETVALALQMLNNWQAGLCPIHGNGRVCGWDKGDHPCYEVNGGTVVRAGHPLAVEQTEAGPSNSWCA